MSDVVAIVDTNVVAAALMTSRRDSLVARMLDGMLTARFPFALSDALLAEYRIVLARPKLRGLHGLRVEELESLLVEIVRHAIVLEPVCAPPAPDPGNQTLWDLLAVRLDLVLVSGDRALQLDEGMSGRVLSPAQFFERGATAPGTDGPDGARFDTSVQECDETTPNRTRPMAARADDIDDRKPQRPTRDAKTPVRPLRTRVTSVDAVIERTVAKRRRALDILAKR